MSAGRHAALNVRITLVSSSKFKRNENVLLTIRVALMTVSEAGGTSQRAHWAHLLELKKHVDQLRPR
ncbi:MAG: hypothetical protein AAF939_22915 [Planctomycetota bacterium]